MTEVQTVPCVIDASVAIKWFLSEVHSVAATRFLQPRFALLAPDLIFAEIGNILWKRQKAGELTVNEATAVLATFSRIDIHITPSSTVIASALQIACSLGRTVYDSLYIALAIRERAAFVTADLRLYNSLHGGPLGANIVWVEDHL